MESIRIPIHGFVEIFDHEKQIIDSQPFQRLRRIHQLALTSMVYPGANHSRFEHSLGVLHLASQAYDAILANSDELRVSWPIAIQQRNRQLLRLAALTHDLGHAPYSHVGDDLFADGESHEIYSSYILCQTPIAQYIETTGKKLAEQHGDEAFFNARTVADLIAHRLADHDPSLHLLRQILDSDLDVDKMDYLLRDSLYCGVAYGNYDLDRLIESLTAVKIDGQKFTLALLEGGLHALEAFILARYWMFIQVYFHKTRRIFDYYLQNFLQRTLPGGQFSHDIDQYLQLHDAGIWSQIETIARDPRHKAHIWADNILHRRIWKQVGKSNVYVHAPEKQAVFIERLKDELREYSAEQVFLDQASKSPHQFTENSYNEKAIPLVAARRVMSIPQKSRIIAQIADPINTFRLYAAPQVFAEVVAIYEKASPG